MSTNRREYQQAYWQLRRRYHLPRRIDATGTVRRLRALNALGWTCAALAAHDGTTTQAALQQVMKHERPTTYVTTATRVARLYDQLSMTPGPSPLAAARARAKGWAPPLAWDDQDLDDPTATPHTDTTPTRATVHLDDVEFLIRTGCTRPTIATRLGVTPGAIDRALHRAGRHDLITRLTQLQQGTAA